MKLALIIIAVTTLLALLLFRFTVPQSADETVAMPWQIKVHDPEHSEVLGIVLNRSTLQQLVERFGQLENVAVFLDKQGEYSLEAYVGKVSIGPLSARLVLNLAATQEELQLLAEATRKRSVTEDGSRKWVLAGEQKSAQMSRSVQGLTYIPGYSGLEESYLLRQFGQPVRRRTVDDHSELWFYPHSGVRILFDQEGREVFEYTSPARFEASLGASHE